MVMNAEQIDQFLAESFPQARGWTRITAIRLGAERGMDELDLLLPFKEENLRPGGTVSGPALMALADSAMYYLLLAKLGPVALAVTTSLNINFLRRPPAADVIATARLLKLGAKLAVGDVHMRTTLQGGALVAQASVTYALPPKT
ncbi:MAG TPA: PaaI family thioesterase [Kofleriaceae bacterium]|nr:PaaI family thioesterase [Kofleriaceae bacterium]